MVIEALLLNICGRFNSTLLNFYVKFIKNVRTIYLLNYIDYDKNEAKNY